MEWTPEQKDAIESNQPVLLISAAAGSGKTAVLVARVMRLLREGGDITRMLIVTFTRAAAAEMRERISAALERETADPRLYRQQQRMGRAQISTLHTFCQTVIRRHFELLGIDPMARVGDDALLSRLLTRAGTEAMEAAYEHPTEAQEILFDAFYPADVLAMADRTRRFLLAMPDPWAWAERATADLDVPLAEHPAFSALCCEVERQLNAAKRTLDGCAEALRNPLTPQRYEKVWEADAALLNEYTALAQQGLLRGGNARFMSLPRGKKTDVDDETAKQAYTDLRDRWKDQVKTAVSLLPTDDRQAVEDDREARRLASGLIALVKEIDARFQSLKRDRNVLDYQDLEQYCLQLLRHESVAREMSAAYDAIFIDEYQDVSPIQEEIIQSLRSDGNRLFLVGDVKQSIYRFRQASPELFMDKYARFPLDADAVERKILLSQNFRSARNVLDSVNAVFSRIMRRETLEIDYDEAAMLRPGPNAGAGEATELRLLISSDEDTGEELRVTDGSAWEARLVAERIRQLMMERLPEDPARPRYRYRDIVILLRNAAGKAALFAQTLQQAGIPVYADADAQYYDLREIQDVMNLLRVVDNPYQDLPLLAVCRVPCFGFTAEELATIRIRDTSSKTPYHQVFYRAAEQPESPLGQKAADMLRRFERWRFLSAHLSPEDFVRLLMDESGIYATAGAAEDGESRQANLRLLCEKAGECETLYEFLTRTDMRTSTDDSRTAKTLSDLEDVVRIMTMHKSKGLEFPVVILAGLARRFRAVNEDQPMLDREQGIALSMVSPDERILRHTISESAMQLRLERKSRAEEARILYVAMTRARERLILIGSPPKILPAFERWNGMRDPECALDANSMLDWIVPSLPIDGPEAEQNVVCGNGAVWRVTLEPIERLKEAETPAPPVRPAMDLGDVDPWLQSLYEAVPPAGRPIKVSVSALKHSPVTEDDLEETPATKRNVSRETLERHPRFLQEHEMTATERGSAVHKALGLVPYDRLRAPDGLTEKAMAECLDRMLDNRQLTRAERDAIRPDQLIRFFTSPLGRRALNAAQVRREWPFALQIGENAYLQGVIDLCFVEDGAWVLVDYKTDAVLQASVLVERYRHQLSWYREALRTLTSMPVKETALYAVSLGEAVSVPDQTAN